MRVLAGFAVMAVFLCAGNADEDGHGAGTESLSIEEINDGAKFLAGMEGSLEGRAADLRGSSEWGYHAQAMSSQWSSYEKTRLLPMEKWGKEMTSPHFPVGGTVRYLFAGPDILHVLKLFPGAGRIILGGLEPVGVLPDLNRLEGRSTYRSLAEVRKAIEESLYFSFFKTADMKVDLDNATFRGTLPIVCLYLVRCGFRIDEIEFLSLQGDGSLSSLGREPKGANAVRVKAKKEGRPPLEVLYFQSNVGNDSVVKSGFLAFLESQPPGASYLKAASYLLHKDYFSAIRSHLLEFSRVVLQDDSGVPMRHFSGSDWGLEHFGNYVAPIPLFSEFHQSDLRRVHSLEAVRSLPFGTGYRWRKDDSNLMLAFRKRVDEKQGEADGEAVVVVAKSKPAEKMQEMGAGRPANGGAGTGSPGLPKEDEADVAAARPDRDDPEVVAVTPAKEEPMAAAEKPVKKDAPPSSEREAPAEAAGKTARYSGGPIDVELRLVRKSELPDGAKQNTLGIYEWEVVRISGGSYGGELIRVAHGLYWGGRPTATARKEIGSTFAVRLVPLGTYPNLAKVPTVNDLGEDDGTVFVPQL